MPDDHHDTYMQAALAQARAGAEAGNVAVG